VADDSNPNLYRSPDGFSVEVLGRTGLRYIRAVLTAHGVPVDLV